MLVSNTILPDTLWFELLLLLANMQIEEAYDAACLDLQGDYNETIETGTAGALQDGPFMISKLIKVIK